MKWLVLKAIHIIHRYIPLPSLRGRGKGVRLFDTDTLTEILDVLSRNKSRTFLTGFGVFWGVFMLVGLIGGGDGLKELLNNNLAGFATNSAIVWAQPTTKPYHGFRKGRQWNMTQADVQRLRAHIPELDVVTPTITRWSATVTHDEQSSS